MESLVRRNRTWYTHRLDELVSTRFVRLSPETRPGWSLFNPSVISVPGGWTVNVRSSNYRIVGGRYEIPPEDGDVIRTDNLLASLADDYRQVSCQLLVHEYPRTGFPVDGLEDVRLNVVDGSILLSATVRNFEPLDGTCRIATSGERGVVTCLPTPPGKHEKNWMPILGRRQWLYACSNNGLVSTVREDAGDWLVETHSHAPHVASGFRGGSQLVPMDNGRWLAVVHEVAEDDGRRIYEHRFVMFNEFAGWEVAGISMPFAFLETRSIEFAAGLARKGDRLVASFGVRDAEAWLVEMTVPEVVNLLVKP
jgi:hypothetical protein